MISRKHDERRVRRRILRLGCSHALWRRIVPTYPALLITLATLAGVYGYRLAANPAKWEEPRRCLVAMEMIERGDYVVPHLFGAPYLNKPPLQNWMIVLFSGNRAERVSPLLARLVSALSAVGVALLLWRLGLSGLRPRADPAPALIFLTLALVMQAGRAGEIDMLFCLLVTGALGCFELGRRAGSLSLRWILSQALVGTAVLTKGFAPILVYPPLFYAVRRRPERGRRVVLAIVIGLATAGLIVMSWFLPFSLMAPELPWLARWTHELTNRVSGDGLLDRVLHVAGYPLRLFVVALPWALVPAVAGWKALRRSWRGIREDPYLELCAASWICGAAVFLFVPNWRERYMLPILPFASVLIGRLLGELREQAGDRRLVRLGRSPYFWLVLALPIVGAAVAGGRLGLERFREQSWVGLAVGLAGLLALGIAARRRAAEAPGLPILALALVYGVVWTGFTEIKTAERMSRFVDEARLIAEHVDPDVPLLIDENMDRRLGWALSERIGRTVRLVGDAERPYLFVASLDAAPGPGATRLLATAEHALYRVEPREVRSRAAPPGAVVR